TCSSRLPHAVDDLARGRDPSLRLLGEHHPAVDQDVQHAEPAGAHPRRLTKGGAQLLRKASCLASEIESDEAALDLDGHQRGSICVRGSRFCGDGFSVPTPCSWTSWTIISLNGVFTLTRRP